MATKIVYIFFFLIFLQFESKSNEQVKILENENNFVELNIIDKITSSRSIEKINIKKFNILKDFEIYVDKCILDSRKGILETSALVQIKDIKNPSKDRVFLFNNWMFATNAAINVIEHPNYDITLKNCG